MRKKGNLVLKFGIFMGMICLPGALPGQSGGGVIQPPALGFVFDSGTLRPILGIPGASQLAKPIDTGLDVTNAAVSPGLDFALLLAGDDRAVSLFRFDTNAASPLAGAMPAPDLLALSPTGSSAALYRASDGLLQVFTGLPDSARLQREIPSATQGDPLTSLAVADDGQLVLAAGEQAAVIIAADGIRPVPMASPLSAMAFQPHSHQVIAASRQSNQVSLIVPDSSVPTIQPLAGPDDGVADPVAVGFSRDGQRVFIANSRGSLLQLDLSGAPPQSFLCDCRISGLHRLAGNSVFRLTAPDHSPVMIFDGDALQPRMLFVPPVSAGGADEVQ